MCLLKVKQSSNELLFPCSSLGTLTPDALHPVCNVALAEPIKKQSKKRGICYD